MSGLMDTLNSRGLNKKHSIGVIRYNRDIRNHICKRTEWVRNITHEISNKNNELPANLHQVYKSHVASMLQRIYVMG